MELTVTGTNAITSPILNAWDWRVGLYLFLGGMSAGLAAMAAVLQLRQGELADGEEARYLAPAAVPVILAVGMLFIFWDLERQLSVFWLYLTLQPLSPMSWGSWGLLLFFPASVLFALAAWPEGEGLRRYPWLARLAGGARPYLRPLAVVNFAMGVFIGIYTGVLLSAFVARPLWNSAILPVLFLASSFSAGTAAMIVIARRKAVKLFFTKIDIGLILAEMVILPLFFYGQYTSSAHNRAAIRPFFSLGGENLWYGMSTLLVVVILPLVLVLKLVEVKEERGEELSSRALLLMNLSAALALAGGLIIRLSLLYAGQLSKLS